MVTRVEQTFFAPGTPGEVPGNCLQAAVASLLDLPLEHVPHFALFEDRWGEALAGWLRVKGYDLWDTGPDTEGPLLAFGNSPRGKFEHAVLWQDGKLLVDPHPDQTGLVGEPLEYWKVEEDGS